MICLRCELIQSHEQRTPKSFGGIYIHVFILSGSAMERHQHRQSMFLGEGLNVWIVVEGVALRPAFKDDKDAANSYSRRRNVHHVFTRARDIITLERLDGGPEVSLQLCNSPNS